MQDWRQRLISGHGVQEALRFMVVRDSWLVKPLTLTPRCK